MSLSASMCLHTHRWTRLNDYKVTSFPEEWMHAHRNLRFLWLTEKGSSEGLDVADEDNDDDEVMIDFYVADKRCRRWQMKRQTVLNFPHQHQRDRIPLLTLTQTTLTSNQCRNCTLARNIEIMIKAGTSSSYRHAHVLSLIRLEQKKTKVALPVVWLRIGDHARCPDGPTGRIKVQGQYDTWIDDIGDELFHFHMRYIFHG